LKGKKAVLLKRLEKQRQALASHFETSSSFLVKCQIIEPYVEKGTLRGCVCPWEIGDSAEEGAFPILEDFHDTLEAIWVWSFHAKASGDAIFKPHIDSAWEYIIRNWKRFIGGDEASTKSLYDCSYVLFSGTFYAEVFGDNQYEDQILQAGHHLDKYLGHLKSTEGREYYDPFWMAYCLGLGAKSMKQKKWLETARAFVVDNVVKPSGSFSKVRNEPRHIGPGGHDFFSKNANKALALISCLDEEKAIRETLLEKFLPCLPRGFVPRHADENAWNAHLATAIGKASATTGSEVLLNRYLTVMDELAARDAAGSAALSRSPSFLRRESWVTFFYAHAFASPFVF
jgi:hypothetical protein